MAINWIAMAIAAALAVGSAVVSAKAAAVTQRNVNRALLRGMNEQDEIDKKQRQVVKALLPEVDQGAQDEFLTEEDKKIAKSLGKTSKAGRKSRQTDIGIAGKLTTFKGERRASKKESEAKYAEKRFHLARYLAPNAVALFLDPKLNESASELREYGVQKGAAGRIADIDAQWQQHNSAGGLKALSTALSVASSLVAIGWGTTADAATKAGTEATKVAVTDAAIKGSVAAGTTAGTTAMTQASYNALSSGAKKILHSGISGQTQLAAQAAFQPALSAGVEQSLISGASSLAGNIPSESYKTVPAFSNPSAQGDVATWSLENPSGKTNMGLWGQNSKVPYYGQKYNASYFPSNRFNSSF